MKILLSTLKKILFWSYERGSWQYDVMCVLILAFIFLSPNRFFHSRSMSTPLVVRSDEIGQIKPDYSGQASSPRAETAGTTANSASEHLSQAKSLFRTGLSKNELTTIRTHIEALPKTAPEYKEAQALLTKVDAEIKQRDREEEARDKQTEVDANPLEVISAKWAKGGFGTVALWHVTFHNRSDKSVGNIKYRTAYFAETGAKVDAGGVDALLSKGLIQKVIGPHQKRSVEVNDGFLNNEAHTANFAVVSWEFIKQE